MQNRTRRSINSLEEATQAMFGLLEEGDGYFLIGGIFKGSDIRTVAFAHGLDGRMVKIIDDISPAMVETILNHVVERLFPTKSESLN